MTYSESLDWLYSQLPMFQRVGPKAFKKDLSTSLALDKAYGHPHRHFSSIHIAGTNGKGSVTHLIATVLQSAGLRVGMYTSPHYVDFRERIKINGAYISEEAVTDFVQQGKELFVQIRPSFFEITVAMAFDYFAREEVDIAVIETGLGGRLDSTNIIQPLLSVITNIGFDHTQFLGGTRPLIAAEKAGIIKPHTPVVIGELHPETKPVFDKKAQQMQAAITYAEEQLKVVLQEQQMGQIVIDAALEDGRTFEQLSLPFGGPYQLQNMRTAIQALSILEKTAFPFQLKEEQLREGFANIVSQTRYQGRWQVLQDAPLSICDSAHNGEGLALIRQQLEQHGYTAPHIVLGMVNDKDTDRSLRELPANATYYFARPDIPRGKAAETLQEEAKAFGLQGDCYDSVNTAIQAAQAACTADNLVMITGSCYVVAEALG